MLCSGTATAASASCSSPHTAIAVMTSLAALALLLRAPAPVVYLAGTSAGWLFVLVRPTHASLLPRLAHSPEELTSAYAATGLIESASALVGPLLAGTLMAIAGSLSGPGLVDAVLAVLLAVGAVCVATIRTRTDPAHDGEPTRARVLVAEAVVGVRAVTADRRSLLLVSAMGLALVQLGFIDVLIVVLAFEVLGTGDAGVGFLTASIGIGSVLGATVAAGLAPRGGASNAFRWGSAMSGLSILGIAAQPAFSAGFLAMSGGAWTVADVNGRIMLQRLIPDKHLSRAFGVLESLYMAGEGLGAFVASLLVLAIGSSATLVVAGVLLPITVLVAWKRLAGLDVGVRVPEGEMDLLRGTRIFAPLPAPMLERVARNLVPVAAIPGSAVIHEGDHGDRFYAIVEGTVDVDVGGRVIATEGPGSCFGEIALLEDVPRTATVTANSDLRLLALDRDDFLRAVTGHEPSGDAARAFAEERKSEQQEFGDDR